jgi:hypothetical protein
VQHKGCESAKGCSEVLAGFWKLAGGSFAEALFSRFQV